MKSSGYPESVLSVLESKILAFVLESWPTTPVHVAEHFHADLSSFEARKRASARFSYYLQKLVEKRLLLSKRVGLALVVWPLQVEKYRAMHAFLKSDETVLASPVVPQKKEKNSRETVSFTGVA